MTTEAFKQSSKTVIRPSVPKLISRTEPTKPNFSSVRSSKRPTIRAPLALLIS